MKNQHIFMARKRRKGAAAPKPGRDRAPKIDRVAYRWRCSLFPKMSVADFHAYLEEQGI